MHEKQKTTMSLIRITILLLLASPVYAYNKSPFHPFFQTSQTFDSNPFRFHTLTDAQSKLNTTSLKDTITNNSIGLSVNYKHSKQHFSGVVKNSFIHYEKQKQFSHQKQSLYLRHDWGYGVRLYGRLTYAYVKGLADFEVSQFIALQKVYIESRDYIAEFSYKLTPRYHLNFYAAKHDTNFLNLTDKELYTYDERLYLRLKYVSRSYNESTFQIKSIHYIYPYTVFNTGQTIRSGYYQYQVSHHLKAQLTYHSHLESTIGWDFFKFERNKKNDFDFPHVDFIYTYKLTDKSIIEVQGRILKDASESYTAVFSKKEEQKFTYSWLPTTRQTLKVSYSQKIIEFGGNSILPSALQSQDQIFSTAAEWLYHYQNFFFTSIGYENRFRKSNKTEKIFNAKIFNLKVTFRW